MDRGYKSPGVSFTENEIFPEVAFPEDLTVGIVGGAAKGPMELTRIRSVQQLESVFGRFGTDGYAVWAARRVLLAGGTVLFQRVVGADAAKATTTVDGEAAPSVVFTAKEFDASLNGAVIQITVEGEKVNYSLTKDGAVIEVLNGMSTDKTHYSYFKKIIDEASKFTVEVGEAALANLTLTVRGGNDGIASLKDADYIGTGNKGLQVFKNPENIDIATLIVPGVSSPVVIAAAEEVINYRGDVMLLPDCPVGMIPTSVIGWVGDAEGGVKFNNAQVAVYYPWVYDVNPYTKEKMITPPSGWVAAQFIYNDKNAGQWFAPAGLQTDYARGRLSDAQGIEYEMSKEERDAIYEANINPIVKFYGKGIALWGNRTMLGTAAFASPSVYTSINVRRMVNYIRKLIISISMTELFNPNDSTTWKSWKQKVNPKLRAIKENRGISSYQIIMDASTVTANDIINGRMPGEIYVQPTRSAEFIPINFTVTQDSVIFTENEEV